MRGDGASPSHPPAGSAAGAPPEAEQQPEALDVLVVPHTHWDREWYHPAGRFRQRLIALVDELLDARHGAGPETAGADAPFLLDGQAVVLDDYLAVRPERRAELAEALAAGALEAGPWYVLADTLLPGGEALVRNLALGRRTVAALGAAPPPVCYSPDAFGHPAALPTIAAGFALPVAIVWRGYGGARWPAGDSAWWQASDGARVLLHHLPPDGYEFGSRLPPALPSARERWAAMRPVLAGRARLGMALVLAGADHHARQERWPEAIEALRRAAAPDHVRVLTLAEAARALLARAEGAAALPVVEGELRDSTGHAWSLQGTFATRAGQKRRNAAAERLLVRDVEPWLAAEALGAGAAGRVPDAGDAPRLRALLDAAWRSLLLCHPHDTLCGCSIDAVARAMDARLDDVEAQGEGLREIALARLLGHDPVLARSRREQWRPALVVRNRAARARGGVAEVELLRFVRDVGVGPGSAGAWRGVHAPARPLAVDGGAVLVQPLERSLRHDRVESPRHYPDDDLVEATRALVWLPPVPGFALRAHALGEPEPDDPATAAGAPVRPPHPVLAADNRLDNGLLQVAADGRGRVRIAVPPLGVDVDGVIGWEDVGDAGDLYTHSPVGAPLASAWCGGARTLHRGPLRGELEVRWRLRVPAALAPREDGDTFSRPTRRGGGHVELPLTVRLAVDAGAAFVRLHVAGENLARDHRLRLVLATGVAGARVVADAAFGPVARDAAPPLPPAELAERVPPTAPLHRYVTLYAAERGVTLYGDGLAEYESLPDGRLAVTLVRAVGELSRPDLPERPGHAGWPAATPEAQCPGAFAASFALLYHGPDTPATRDLVERTADDVLLPLCGETWRSLLAHPGATGGVALEGAGLALSAAAPGDDGQVVLRCVNVTAEPVAGRWRIGAPVAAAALARLDGTALEPLHVVDEWGGAAILFAAAPHAVVTVLVRPTPAGVG